MYIKNTEITTTIDADGNEVQTTIEKTAMTQHNTEPDYIKLYTRMWCEFNDVPNAYRNLFLELATRMTYCNTTDLEHSQIVYTGRPISTAIMTALGWKPAMYYRGLKELENHGAIRRINKGVYQINPNYAGKGEWKYNPRYNRGGVEDLIATFNFRDKNVDTRIVWADDGTDDEINKIFRDGMQTNANDETILKERKVSNG